MKVINSIYLFIKHLLLSVFRTKKRLFSDEERERLDASFRRICAIQCEIFADEPKSQIKGKKFLECSEGIFILPDNFTKDDFLAMQGLVQVKPETKHKKENC
ncbi:MULTISPECIES: hypothetical protein [Entomomonas]|uniref:Uncharacterized protein n=1 Tax=Entomomonas asaccharolytica TaxID=2785331 RepID=A0A974NHD4_9GAMM|nr:MULTISPECIES: hypothetical protein [Entomomonas]QQP86865.1 hypothetical protein JHT90_06380 [Entomomonas asaccharolytica]UYZ83517.1 hypothetical protein MTZ49_13075 [Entomomonas sp. E2T0]